MELVAIRHCESEANAKGIIASSSRIEYPLTGRGLECAKALVPVLSQYSFDVIIVSPLIRAQQTVEPYIKKYGYKICITLPLIKEINAGVFCDRPKKEFYEWLIDNNLWGNIVCGPPEGESLAELYNGRVAKFQRWLKEYFTTETILLCWHGTYGKVFHLRVSGMPISEYYNQPVWENGEIMEYTF